MTKGTHPKGICELRKFLHKAQVRLTQAGSLIVRGLGRMRKCAVCQRLRRLLFQKYALNRCPRATFLYELT
jgi:hypothetical protein